MTDRRLILVRHGVTHWNREGRFQGHLDSPLSDAGRHEARLVAARLAADPRLRPARIVSSSLGRAMDTAVAIAEPIGVSIEVDARLMEIGQGEWEGRTRAELETADPIRYSEWREASGIRQPPGGEPVDEATRRVAALLDDVVASESWPVCLVSHGGTMRILALGLLGLGVPTPPALDVDNASLSVVRGWNGSWHLERWNDALHLLGQEPTHIDEVDGRPLSL
ncbi:MAG TPA: histidine phosphatase family protein [Candidatus Limnocylindria bacterium]